jgi:iron(II)-dependent oxidoreductase
VHTTDDSLCDDNNACTQDSCNELLGCENSPLVDGSACCILDADCSDGIPCTTDTCDATLGCIREPNDAACNDADSCTDDVCVPDFGCANPPAKEICDDIDNDCDGETDEEVGGPGTCGCLGEPCPPGFGCTVFGTCEALDEVYIPAGSFWRGCNEALDPYCSGGNNYNDHPQMLVTVPAFFIDRTEVTAAEYQACVNAGVCTVPFTTSAYATYGVAMLHDHPMNHVRWSQAGEYCAWSGKAEGVQRLCTESEWAMAARGSCTIHGEPCNELMPTYPWGEETPNCTLVVMNTCTNETQPVDSKPAGASPYGVLGMAGNVQEWVQDCFNYFTYAPTDGSANEDSPCTRVRRAGSWIVSGGQLRAGYRISGGSALNDEYTGFRCCRSAP